METVMEDEEYTYRDVFLPTLIPRIPAPGLERGTVERRRGRDIVIAIDHGPNSKHAFDWALIHLVRLADTLYLVHAVSSYHFLTCFFFFFKGWMPTYQLLKHLKRRSCSMNPTQRYGCSQKGWTGAFWLMGVRSEIVYEASQALMEKLSVEAFQIAMVRTMARIVSGDAGKVICKEAERVKPAAVVMGTRGRSLIQRFAFSLIPSSIHV
ncbi:hypothetical protein Gotri_002996 [Gossypium trilobum]|uniref:UspA domain-containing protein n=3 Tax=Gossypium TaxID=3633 RepID=A0A7J9F9Y6_9ROSI|nr:hypothetical protein [Gossypium trilobum]MBA0815141.1 hypothetical protein [Gossypium harknessii]